MKGKEYLAIRLLELEDKLSELSPQEWKEKREILNKLVTLKRQLLELNK